MALQLVQRSADPAFASMVESVARGRKIDDNEAREIADAAKDVSLGAAVNSVSAEYVLPVTTIAPRARFDRKLGAMVSPTHKELFLRSVAQRINHVRHYLKEVDPTTDIVRTEAYWNPAENIGRAYFRFVRKATVVKVGPAE
jgi:hypothetical protein